MAKKQPGDAPESAAPEQPAAPAEQPKKPAKAKPEAKAKPDAKPPAAPAPAEPAEGAPAAEPPEEGPKKKSKQPGIPPRRGKKLRNWLKDQQAKIAKEGAVPLKRAIQLIKQFKKSKEDFRKAGKRKGFDESFEVHMSLGIDSTQSDQMIRGSVPLPHGVGKSVRVVVFCQGENVAKAKEAGADFAGSDELIKKVQGEGWLDFDVALATQDMMGQVSRLGKVLGPRGLMPTPKAGTVITAGTDVGQVVREFKAGKVEYRSDKGGNVHAGVGKMSFDEAKIAENVTTFIEQIRSVKPSGVKGHYIKSVTLAATMSPGLLLQV